MRFNLFFFIILFLLHWKKTTTKALKNPHETKFIEIFNKNLIRTLKVGDNDDATRVPILLVHGFAAGGALWMWNLDALSKDRNVYAIDLLGFARSSRPVFPDSPEEVDQMFVRSIEEWRRQVKLESFILVGYWDYKLICYCSKRAH